MVISIDSERFDQEGASVEIEHADLSRRSFFKGSAALGVAALGCLGAGGALVGCQSGASLKEKAPSKAEEAKSDTLKIFVGDEPEDGFDPLTGWGYNGSYIIFQSRLLKFDHDLTLQPDLAKEWSVSPDGLTYTFKLRDDVKFSDGSAFTAKDVVFSYITARDNGASVVDLTRLVEAKPVDDHIVEFVLSERDSSFAAKAGKLGIVPAALYDPQSYRKNPVGTGPFKLDQWDAGQQVIISPNEHYYGTKSPFKQITLLFLDSSAALSNAQSGSMDVVMVQPEYAKSIVKGMTLETYDTIDTRGFNLPTAPESIVDGKKVGNNVTADKAIRKALAIGVDRKAIIDNALNGIGTPSTALITQVAWTNPACQFKDGRVDEAKRLLDEAGWKEGADGIREKDGMRAEFEITGRTDDPQRFNIAEALSQEAKKLGIKINATSQLWSDCKANAASVPTCFGTGDYDPSGDICSYYKTGSRWNCSQYSNSTVDGYIEAALEADDHDKAIEDWKKAQWDGTTGPESENGDLPALWLVSIDHTYFVRDGLDLGEQTVHPHGHGWPIVANIEEWRWA